MTTKKKIRESKLKSYRDFQEILLEQLQDPEFAEAYLKSALADEDERIFLVAIRNIWEARGGNMANLAEVTHLNKQNLYRMLSKDGNPRFTSLKSILDAVGFQMDVNPKKPATKRATISKTAPSMEHAPLKR
jgi:probable addiction module antidote protein